MRTRNDFLVFKRICVVLSLVIAAVCTSKRINAQTELPLSELTDSMTVALLKVDTKRVKIESFPSQLRGVSPVMTSRLGQFLESAKGASIAVTASIPSSPEVVPSTFRNRARGGSVLRLVVPNAVAEGDLKKHPFLEEATVEKLNNSMVAFSSKATGKRFSQSATDRQAWNSCQASLGATPIQLLVVPPEHFRLAMVELQPMLPASLGAGPTSTIVDGLLWMAIGLDPGFGDINITIQSKSDEAAKALVDSLPKLLSAISQAEPQASFAKGVTQLLELTQPTISNSQISFRLKLSESEQMGQVLVAILKSVFGPVSNSQKLSIFKQVILAVHNFESANQHLPPLKAHRNEDGSSKLSWRVHLLPYLGEMELYQKFHLNESWDSPHNKPLVERMPDCYRLTGYQELTEELPLGHTTIVAPSGEDTVLGSKDVVTFAKVTDGLSNTVILVEVKHDKAVPWTSPQDYNYDPKNPLAGIFVDVDGRFVVGMGDGSTSRLENSLPLETYDYSFRKSDGHAIAW